MSTYILITNFQWLVHLRNVQTLGMNQQRSTIGRKLLRVQYSQRVPLRCQPKAKACLIFQFFSVLPSFQMLRLRNADSVSHIFKEAVSCLFPIKRTLKTSDFWCKEDQAEVSDMRMEPPCSLQFCNNLHVINSKVLLHKAEGNILEHPTGFEERGFYSHSSRMNLDFSTKTYELMLTYWQ